MRERTTEAEVERIRQALCAAVGARKRSVSRLERKAGVSEGSLRKVLAGDVSLTMRYILLILEALGLSWGEFFRSAFRARNIAQGEPIAISESEGDASLIRSFLEGIDRLEREASRSLRKV